MAKKHVVAALGEIPPGGRKLVTADGRAIVVLNLDGEFFALGNRCPHRGGSLCDGNLTGLVLSDEPGHYNYIRRGEIIRCPWHSWEFDIRPKILVRPRQGQGAALRRVGGEGRQADSKGPTSPRRSA